LILVGDSTVGKSSILKSFTEGKFAEVCDPTVGVDFYARLVEIRPGLRIKLQLWDTAGQEKFRSITRSYYRNSVGVLVVYDITRRDSFEHIAAWIHEARINIGAQPCVFQLIGHKADLESERQVLYEEGEYFAKYHKIKFLETSAKTGENVEEAFNMLARDIYGRVESGEIRLQDGWDGVKSGLIRHGSTLSLSDERPPSEDGLCQFC